MMETDVIYPLWTPEHVQNPYPLYHRLLAEAPVLNQWGDWIVSDYEAVQAILLDRRSSSRRGLLGYLPEEERERFRDLIDINERMMLFLDAPDHTRLRGLVAQAFSAKMIESMRPRIQGLVDLLLADIEPGQVWDVMTTLAQPLPSMVITEMLGMPLEDWPRIRYWSEEYAAWLGSVHDSPELRERANSAMADFRDYIDAQSALRRADPRDDLLTALVHAEEDGDRLTHQEVLSTCLLLLFAGNETTTNLIANGLLALMRHPDAMRQLHDDPSLIRTAVEEFLRYESPVQFTGRWLPEPLEAAGTTIPGGVYVTTLLGAANRDPRHFEQPDTLDITRRPNRHISFAHGAHFCLGAPLARAEAQLAINAVVQRFPNLGVQTDDVTWIHNPVFRSLTALWVRAEGE
jgi:pimeloyl-[acyl-carrier protein] synthase